MHEHFRRPVRTLAPGGLCFFLDHARHSCASSEPEQAWLRPRTMFCWLTSAIYQPSRWEKDTSTPRVCCGCEREPASGSACSGTAMSAPLLRADITLMAANVAVGSNAAAQGWLIACRLYRIRRSKAAVPTSARPPHTGQAQAQCFDVDSRGCSRRLGRKLGQSCPTSLRERCPVPAQSPEPAPFPAQGASPAGK